MLEMRSVAGLERTLCELPIEDSHDLRRHSIAYSLAVPNRRPSRPLPGPSAPAGQAFHQRNENALPSPELDANVPDASDRAIESDRGQP